LEAEITCYWPTYGRIRRSLKAATADDGAGTLRSPAAILVLSMRVRPIRRWASACRRVAVKSVTVATKSPLAFVGRSYLRQQISHLRSRESL
jgi:hypothetical protein